MELLRDFERLLVRRHRFALGDVLVSLRAVVHALLETQRTLALADWERVRGRLQRAAQLVPTFPGARELAALLAALQPLRAEEANTLQPLVEATKRLKTAAQKDAAVLALLNQKRDYLAKFLDDAAQVLENSHARRVQQYEAAIAQLTEDFKLALLDEKLQRAQQLRYDIGTIETSMSTMLLPHFEICRTITTANAQVQAAGSSFSKAECAEIDAFVQTAAKLKSGDATFCSILQETSAFLIRLALFEKAASKDAFLVCSSALKLQFRESLDQELFLAYVEDWSTKRKSSQIIESSSEFRAATTRLQDLKTAIARAHELVQSNQKKLAMDDPARTSLMQEVARIFRDEGGTMARTNLN